MVTKLDILALSTMVVDNNYYGVIESMRANGYIVPNGRSKKDLISDLMSIFNRSKSNYFRVIKNVSYLPTAQNYTGTQKFREQMMQYLVNNNVITRQSIVNAKTGTESDTDAIFTTIGDFFGGQQVIDSNSTTTNKPGKVNGWVVGGGVIIIITLLIIYFKS